MPKVARHALSLALSAKSIAMSVSSPAPAPAISMGATPCLRQVVRESERKRGRPDDQRWHAHECGVGYGNQVAKAAHLI
jgi:hypothetical protein